MDFKLDYDMSKSIEPLMDGLVQVIQESGSTKLPNQRRSYIICKKKFDSFYSFKS